MNRAINDDNTIVQGRKICDYTLQEEDAVTRREFATLIEEEGKAVYSFCFQLTGNRDEADDLYQETMLKAMECHIRIDARLGSPKSFLMGIAAKTWKCHKKKYARRRRIAPEESMEEMSVPGEIPDAGISPEEAYLSRELCRIVRAETAALKEKYRIPVCLFYTAGLSVEEISRSLHIPKGTVKSRLHTARTIIGRKLEEHGYER